jgi:uncharacterized protein YndB with AHSA1/START domain
MRFVVSETLDAPREAVFDVVSDPRRRTEWQSSLRSVQLLTKGEPGLGTRWYEYTRGGLRFDLEITAFERPSRWAERGGGRAADAALDVRFEEGPTRGSTLLVVEVDVTLKGVLKLASPMVRRLMPIALRGDLARVVGLARARGR